MRPSVSGRRRCSVLRLGVGQPRRMPLVLRDVVEQPTDRCHPAAQVIGARPRGWVIPRRTDVLQSTRWPASSRNTSWRSDSPWQGDPSKGGRRMTDVQSPDVYTGRTAVDPNGTKIGSVGQVYV